MAFYNLGNGGDATNNPNYGVYPQNAYLEGVNGQARALLRPAEHMSPATYNIWRNIRFGKEKLITNHGVRDFLNRLYSNGQNIVADDVLGIVTVPHEAIVQGVYYRVESPQEGTSFQIVRVTTGEAIGPVIDASVARVGFVEVNFVVPPDTNESFGIRIVTWPELDETAVDPCGVYGPCDDLTLCFTLNVFMWSPVAEWFCTDDPCYGQGAGPRDDGYMGGGAGTDPDADANNPELEGIPNAANSTVTGGAGTVAVTVEDAAGEPVEGATVELRQGTEVVATATTGADGVANFADVAAGEYAVWATAEGGTPASLGNATVTTAN